LGNKKQKLSSPLHKRFLLVRLGSAAISIIVVIEVAIIIIKMRVLKSTSPLLLLVLSISRDRVINLAIVEMARDIKSSIVI